MVHPILGYDILASVGWTWETLILLSAPGRAATWRFERPDPKVR